MRGAAPAPEVTITEVGTLLLPALVAGPVQAIAATVGDTPARVAHYARQLTALTGRLLAPGGWTAGARHADAEPLTTGRTRPYDESTLRQGARVLRARGAVAAAEAQLEAQVAAAVGDDDVTAFTDVYDQVYWTKKPAWAGPVGGLANRRLACTYFGLTFVRPAAGPVLAYHVSWHKPAAPLRDTLEAVHAAPDRHAWLGAHVALHVLDRGTQGDPTLGWALAQGIPYLTLARASAHWRRFATPTAHTAQGVPVFVRRDTRLPAAAPGRATTPRVIIFPAAPDAGRASGRALRYRTAASLTDDQVVTLDAVYKARWPSNENPIKALIAVGFDRNRDRTLDATTSRGRDGEIQRCRDRLAATEAAIAALAPQPTGAVVAVWKRLCARRDRAVARLAAVLATPAETLGARTDRGGEHLCKVLTLLLYNALNLLLWRSVLPAVRVLTPARVRDLLLGCHATVAVTAGRLELGVTALREPTEREQQAEVVRLFNAVQLTIRGLPLAIKLRDPPAILAALRIAA